jgi:DNA-binding NarL/FixJ family response regulator
MMTDSPTRILLADDHALVRRGVRLILDAEPHLTVVAEADDGAEAVARAREHRPDLAVLDIAMPRLTGLQAARELSRTCPETRILILTMYDNEQYFFEALGAGASGYVLKSVADRDPVEACRATMRGEPFLYPGAVDALIRDHLDRAREGGTASPRTRPGVWGPSRMPASMNSGIVGRPILPPRRARKAAARKAPPMARRLSACPTDHRLRGRAGGSFHRAGMDRGSSSRGLCRAASCDSRRAPEAADMTMGAAARAVLPASHGPPARHHRCPHPPPGEDDTHPRRGAARHTCRWSMPSRLAAARKSAVRWPTARDQ